MITEPQDCSCSSKSRTTFGVSCAKRIPDQLFSRWKSSKLLTAGRSAGACTSGSPCAGGRGAGRLEDVPAGRRCVLGAFLTPLGQRLLDRTGHVPAVCEGCSSPDELSGNGGGSPAGCRNRSQQLASARTGMTSALALQSRAALADSREGRGEEGSWERSQGSLSFEEALLSHRAKARAAVLALARSASTSIWRWGRTGSSCQRSRGQPRAQTPALQGRG